MKDQTITGVGTNSGMEDSLLLLLLLLLEHDSEHELTIHYS